MDRVVAATPMASHRMGRSRARNREHSASQQLRECIRALAIGKELDPLTKSLMKYVLLSVGPDGYCLSSVSLWVQMCTFLSLSKRPGG